MTHKLMISVKVSHEDTRNGYLQPYELVRGEPAKINFSVTNIGVDEFPGGSIPKAVLNFEGGQSIFRPLDEQLPRLVPSEEHELSESVTVLAIAEGPAWLLITIEATDSQPIDYYQTRTGLPIGQKEWEGALYVVNREHIHIIGLLQAKLEENR